MFNKDKNVSILLFNFALEYTIRKAQEDKEKTGT